MKKVKEMNKETKATTEEILEYLKEEEEGLIGIEDVEDKLLGRSRITVEHIERRKKFFKKKIRSWSEIKHAYIHGIEHPELGHIYPKVPEMAFHLGISEHTLYQKVSKGKWNLIRAYFRQMLQEKQDQEHLRLLLSESARYEQQQLKIFEKIQNIVEEKIDNHKQTEIQVDPITEERKEVIVREMSAKDLQTLTNTLSTCPLHRHPRSLPGRPATGRR